MARAKLAGHPGALLEERAASQELRPLAKHDGRVALLFLAPYLLLFLIFQVLPTVLGLYVSLHDWTFLGPHHWAGLANYAALFRRDHAVGYYFWQSLQHTGLFMLLGTPLLVTVPLAVALLMNARIAGRAFFRATFFAPYVLGVAVIGVLWRYLLDPTNGLVNHLLGRVIPWTTDLPWVWVTIVSVTVWWTLGFNAVVYLTGLQDIPQELYDAASLDGATRVQQFWHITLPGLRQVIALVTTTTLIGCANLFGQAVLLTGGGPAYATRSAVMYIAGEGLGRFRIGQATAMGFFLALLISAVGLINLRVFRHEEG